MESKEPQMDADVADKNVRVAENICRICGSVALPSDTFMSARGSGHMLKLRQNKYIDVIVRSHWEDDDGDDEFAEMAVSLDAPTAHRVAQALLAMVEAAKRYPQISQITNTQPGAEADG